MLMDRQLQIEVLINSPGPHDMVRVRQPFLALQDLGVNCRLHERPFRFNHCIRPHSLVIWQRPLPISWERQIEHLQWLRERGCLLLTEWDDHPDLFPEPIQEKLQATGMAPLIACHAIHSSSAALISALSTYHPLVLGLENGVRSIPPLSICKHQNAPIRVFIGNQNREHEHSQLVPQLRHWLEDNPDLTAVVIGDEALAKGLNRPRQIELHPWLAYADYRQLLRSCQLALLPLQPGVAERCKTVIKWAEAAAESVAVIAGPELYPSVQRDHRGQTTCRIASHPADVVPHARDLAIHLEARLKQITAAYHWVQQDWNLDRLLPERLRLYQELWMRRSKLDTRLMERLGAKASILHQAAFLA